MSTERLESVSQGCRLGIVSDASKEALFFLPEYLNQRAESVTAAEAENWAVLQMRQQKDHNSRVPSCRVTLPCSICRHQRLPRPCLFSQSVIAKRVLPL